MQRLTTKTATLVGAATAGCLAAGVLLSLTIPTGMQRAEDDSVSALAVTHEVTDYSPAVSFEAPPEDLAPQRWDATNIYSPAGSNDAWVQPVDTYAEAPYVDDSQPAEFVEVATSRDVAVLDDSAAASAEAAEAAAAAVRAVQNAASDPSPDAATDPQASTQTS